MIVALTESQQRTGAALTAYETNVAAAVQCPNELGHHFMGLTHNTTTAPGYTMCAHCTRWVYGKRNGAQCPQLAAEEYVYNTLFSEVERCGTIIKDPRIRRAALWLPTGRQFDAEEIAHMMNDRTLTTRKRKRTDVARRDIPAPRAKELSLSDFETEYADVGLF